MRWVTDVDTNIDIGQGLHVGSVVKKKGLILDREVEIEGDEEELAPKFLNFIFFIILSKFFFIFYYFFIIFLLFFLLFYYYYFFIFLLFFFHRFFYFFCYHWVARPSSYQKSAGDSGCEVLDVHVVQLGYYYKIVVPHTKSIKPNTNKIVHICKSLIKLQ